ncbi:carbohydrate-binding module family 50 protein [Saccharata proteae CBS 121410]|uniref:Carbohydrate-binding module family 50 protein n=1 Tax=Saccharata proteae CBS 121410 TaxID=1314787 RepID=A0A9P4I229_9PEZI|nr:carbohydrate-binding module family 50 protein [Saccharata proteae CBS 121410]
MAHYSTLDEDENRLPEGMTRVGYDADTGRYTYQDSDGSYWEGPSGARYGRLERVEDGGQDAGPHDALLEAQEQRAIKASNKRAWQYMLPFFLIIIVFLLMLFRFLNSSPGGTAPIRCPQDSYSYAIKGGDTCWSIAHLHELSDPQLLRDANPGLDCDNLAIGKEICIPDPNE